MLHNETHLISAAPGVEPGVEPEVGRDGDRGVESGVGTEMDLEVRAERVEPGVVQEGVRPVVSSGWEQRGVQG